MSIIFYIVYVIWFLSEIFVNRFSRSEKTRVVSGDKGSLVILWIIFISANFSAVFITNIVELPVSTAWFTGFFGCALIISGLILRLTVIASLGRFFSVDVAIKQRHRLKKDGFYRYLRHPSYFASLMSFTGFGISLNNWISLLIVTMAAATGFIIRIRVEEKLLIDHFGAEYTLYIKRTWRFIPFIY